MRPGSGWELALSQVSFATIRAHGPSVQILIGLPVLSARSALSTPLKIDPLNGV